MPKLMDDGMQENIKIPGGGNFSFSAIRLDNLGATEYTLVTIVTDVTGSVSGFAKELLEMKKTIIKACKKSPRAENLLVRDILFNDIIGVREVHGFKLLNMIDPDKDYQPFNPNGATPLYQATYEGIGATISYSKSLMDQDFNCNGAVYIITDGEDNVPGFATPAKIEKMVKDAEQKETIIESLITVLIGVNARQCTRALNEFHVNAGLTQYIDAGDATPQRLAKLAGWVSKSISSQSQALGSGSASQPLQF